MMKRFFGMGGKERRSWPRLGGPEQPDPEVLAEAIRKAVEENKLDDLRAMPVERRSWLTLGFTTKPDIHLIAQIVRKAVEAGKGHAMYHRVYELLYTEEKWRSMHPEKRKRLLIMVGELITKEEERVADTLIAQEEEIKKEEKTNAEEPTKEKEEEKLLPQDIERLDWVRNNLRRRIHPFDSPQFLFNELLLAGDRLVPVEDSLRRLGEDAKGSTDEMRKNALKEEILLYREYIKKMPGGDQLYAEFLGTLSRVRRGGVTWEGPALTPKELSVPLVADFMRTFPLDRAFRSLDSLATRISEVEARIEDNPPPRDIRVIRGQEVRRTRPIVLATEQDLPKYTLPILLKIYKHREAQLEEEIKAARHK